MLSEAKLSYTFLTGIPGRKILAAACGTYGDSKVSVRPSGNVLQLSGSVRKAEKMRQVFEWVNGMDAASSVISFIRKSSACEEHFLFIL